MTAHESQEDQAILFDDDEQRLIHLEGIPEGAREALADLLILLRRGMTKDGCGPLVVQAELGRFIELHFQRSEAYRLALKLYAGRYEVIACKDIADIMREAIEQHMPDRDEQTLIDDSETESQSEQ